MSHLSRGLLGLVAAALLLVGDAAAHDVWLQAGSHARPGESIVANERADVRLLVGHGEQDAEPVARNDRLILGFTAHGPGGVQLPVPGLHGRDPAGIFRPDRPGLWSLTYVGHPRENRLDAAAFEAFLAEEGLDWVSELRRASGQSGRAGRELYSRSLEELVPVCGAATASSTPLPRLGDVAQSSALPVRFVLNRDGRNVRVRLVADGEPVAGTLVDLRRDGRLVASLRTDGDGSLRLRPEAGSWVVTAVTMEKADDPRADWRTYFAALTFPWPLDACP